MSIYGPQPVAEHIREQQDRFPRGIAKAAGLPVGYVRQVIGGERAPDTETFLALAEVLGLDVEDCWTPEIVRIVRSRGRR